MSSTVREDYTIRLRAVTPIHVGGSGSDGIADLAPATDGQGRLVVPGSSWAGVLRALLRGIATEPVVDAVFGPPTTRDGAGHASRLSVFDSVLDTSGLAMRTGVHIHRRTGAAARGLLYDRLVVPPGQVLELRLRYDGPPSTAVRDLVAAVVAHGLTVGAATSRGLGRLEGLDATVTSVDLSSAASLLTRLAGRAEAKPVDPADTTSARAVVSIAWRPAQPVLVGDAREGAQAQLLPLLTTRPDGALGPVLPGSSVKGVLRAAAERIVRTLRHPDPATTHLADGDLPIDTLALGEPVLAVLFGSTERRGALTVADVTADPSAVIDADAWQRDAVPSWAAPRTRVALDRWTGAAADQRLYTTLEPRVWSWEPIRLELDPARLSTDQWRALLVLLGLVIAEVWEGRVGFGRGTTRGLGEIQIQAVTVTGLPPELPGYDGSDWWTWLRDLADGRELPELLDLAREPVEATA